MTKSEFIKLVRAQNIPQIQQYETDQQLWEYLVSVSPELGTANFKDEPTPIQTESEKETAQVFISEINKENANDPNLEENTLVKDSIFKESAKLSREEWLQRAEEGLDLNEGLNIDKQAQKELDTLNMMKRRDRLVKQNEPIINLGETEGMRNVLGGSVRVAKPLAVKLVKARNNLKEQGLDLHIMDSLVRPEDKERSYRAWVDSGKRGPKQSHPDTSFHPIGYAVDLSQLDEHNMRNPLVHQALKDVGLKQHPDEWWHWSEDPDIASPDTYAGKVNKKFKDIPLSTTYYSRAEKDWTDQEKAVVRQWKDARTKIEQRIKMPDATATGDMTMDYKDWIENQGEFYKKVKHVENFLGRAVGGSLTGEAVQYLMSLPDVGAFKDENYNMYDQYLEGSSAEYWTDNAGFLEEVATSVLAFLLPLDKAAFKWGGKMLSAPVAGNLKRISVMQLVKAGTPLKQAQAAVDKGYYGILERMLMTGSGIGSHTSALDVAQRINDQNRSPDLYDAWKTYWTGVGLGSVAALTGDRVGKIKFIEQSLRGAGGSIADFLAEVTVFSMLGPVVHDRDAIPESLAEKTEFFIGQFSHTAGMMLALKYILSNTKGYPFKVKLKEGDALKIEKSLEKNYKETNDPVEAVKRTVEEHFGDKEITAEQAREAARKHIESQEQLDLFHSEQTKNLKNAKKPPKTKEREKEAKTEAEKQLDQQSKEIELEQAISEGNIQKAADIARELTPEGINPDVVVKKALSNIKEKESKDTNKALSRRRRKFLNISATGTYRTAQGRAEGMKTGEKLSKYKEKGQKELWKFKEKVKTEETPTTTTKKKGSSETIKDVAQLQESTSMRIPKMHKPLEGHKSKTYNSFESAKRAADKIQSENIPKKLVFLYQKRTLPNGKVKWVMRAVQPTGKITSEAKYPKRTERMLGQETTSGKNPITAKEVVSDVKTVKNPNEAKSPKEKKELLIKEHTALTETANKQIREINDLIQELSKPAANKKAVIEVEKNTKVIRARKALEATRKALERNYKDRLKYMSSKELSTIMMLDAVALAKMDQVGAVGKDVGKLKTSEQRRLERRFRNHIKEFLKRASSVGKNSKEAFKEFIGRQGLKGRHIEEYIDKNFEKIKQQAGVENAVELLEMVEGTEVLRSRYGGEEIPLKPAHPEREEEYAGALNISRYDPQLQKLIKEVSVKIGRTYDEVEIRDRKDWKKGEWEKELNRRSKDADVQREVYKLVVEGKSSSLDLKKHVVALGNNVATTAEVLMRNPRSEPLLKLFALNLEAYMKVRSSAGSALRATQLRGNTNLEIVRELLSQEKNMSKEALDVVRLMDIVQKAPLGATENRAWLWKVAEYARNMKLLSASSYAKSFLGNTSMSLMEISSRFARVPLAYAFSTFSGQTTGISRHEAYMKFGKSKSFRNGFLDKETGGLKVAWELMKENAEYQKSNPLLANEAFGTEIKGMWGKAVRIPQNLHGAVDAMYRIPWTVSWQYTLAQRAAVRELKSEKLPIDGRSVAVRTDRMIKEQGEYYLNLAKTKAREQVFQKELQSHFGRRANQLRTGKGHLSAFANIINPFVITYTNVIKKGIEFSPLGFFNKPLLNMYGDIMHHGIYKVFGESYGKKEMKADPDLAAELGARALVGLGITSVTLWGLDRMMEGKMQGSWGDKDREEKEALEQLGFKEFAVEFVDGTASDIRGLDPISTYLQAMIAYAEAPESATTMERLVNTGIELGAMFAGHPIAMVMEDFSLLMKDQKSFSRIIGRMTSSLWQPTIVRQLSRITDPTRMKEFREGDVTTDGEYVTKWDAARRNIITHNIKDTWFYNPIKRYTDEYMKNYPQQDIFGRPIVTQTGYGALLGVRNYDMNTLPDEWKKLYQEYVNLFPTGIEAESFSKPSSFIKKGDITVKLSNEEQFYYEKAVGEAYSKLLIDHMNDPRFDYDNLSANQKRKFWLDRRRGSDGMGLYTSYDGDTQISVTEFVKSYLLRDLTRAAVILDDINKNGWRVEDVSRWVNKLYQIAPDISTRDAQQIVTLVKKGPTVKADAGESNFEQAITILRKNMPKEERAMWTNNEKLEDRIKDMFGE
jgi:hypothetical protein